MRRERYRELRSGAAQVVILAVTDPREELRRLSGDAEGSECYVRGKGRMDSAHPHVGEAARAIHRKEEKTTPTIVPCAGPRLNLVNQVAIPETL